MGLDSKLQKWVHRPITRFYGSNKNAIVSKIWCYSLKGSWAYITAVAVFWKYYIVATSVNLQIMNFARAIFTDQSKGLILSHKKTWAGPFFTILGHSKFTDLGWRYRTKYIFSRPVKNESRLIFYGCRSLKVLNPGVLGLVHGLIFVLFEYYLKV